MEHYNRIIPDWHRVSHIPISNVLHFQQYELCLYMGRMPTVQLKITSLLFWIWIIVYSEYSKYIYFIGIDTELNALVYKNENDVWIVCIMYSYYGFICTHWGWHEKKKKSSNINNPIEFTWNKLTIFLSPNKYTFQTIAMYLLLYAYWFVVESDVIQHIFSLFGHFPLFTQFPYWIGYFAPISRYVDKNIYVEMRK